MTSDEQKQARDAGARFPVDDFDLMMRAAREIRDVAVWREVGDFAELTTLANDLEALAKRLYPGCFKP